MPKLSLDEHIDMWDWKSTAGDILDGEKGEEIKQL